MMYFYNQEIFKKSPLLMDVYEPRVSESEPDPEKKRAVVIVSHGGAFITGSKNDFDQKSVAYTDSLAARGFVTASLEYRQGGLMETVNNSEAGLSAEVYEHTATIDSVDFSRTVIGLCRISMRQCVI